MTVKFRISNFEKFKDSNYGSFTAFPSALPNSAVFFSDFQNFLKSKRGNLISWREPVLQNG